jgi:hypothetical protein
MEVEELVQLEEALAPLAIPTGGIVAAGIPIGDPAFVHNHLKGAFMEANSIINNIHRVMVSAQRIKPRIVQDLYKIIRWCIAPAKINHFLRNIPKATLLPYIKAYDEAVYNLTLTITSLDHSLHRSSTRHGHISKLLAQLPANRGGLGLTSAEATADAQRAGNLALTANLVATALGPSFDPATKGKLVLPELYDLFHPDKVKDKDPLLATPVAEMWATQLKKVASSFNSSSHGPAQQHVLSLITNLDNKAYLLSGTKEGSAWLLSYLSKRLTDPEFQALLRARIQAPATDGTPPEGRCSCCGLADGGIGVHALECQEINQGKECSAENKSSRHVSAKFAVIGALNYAIKEEGAPFGTIPLREPIPGDYWIPKEDKLVEAAKSRADILFPKRATEGQERVVYVLGDVSCPHPSSKDGRGGLKAATVEGGAASGEVAERKKENHYKKLFHVPVGGMLPIIMETGGRLTEKTRRALSSYIRRDIMGVEDEDKWTPHLLARYNVYWRGLIDAMVVGLVKQVAGTLLDNCAIRKRSAAFSPRAPARGTGEVSEEMDVVSPGAPRGGARVANGPS